MSGRGLALALPRHCVRSRRSDKRDLPVAVPACADIVGKAHICCDGVLVQGDSPICCAQAGAAGCPGRRESGPCLLAHVHTAACHSSMSLCGGRVEALTLASAARLSTPGPLAPRRTWWSRLSGTCSPTRSWPRTRCTATRCAARARAGRRCVHAASPLGAGKSEPFQKDVVSYFMMSCT